MSHEAHTTPNEGVRIARTTPRDISVAELCSRYEVVLFDAFGVLVDGAGPLAGARELISHLNSIGKNYLIVTNASSRTSEGIAERFNGEGLEIPVERIVSSGDLLGGFFRKHGLQSPRCAVLGGPNASVLVSRAGGEILEVDAPGHPDVVFLSDLARIPGDELMNRIDGILNRVARAIRAGREPLLVVGNPDPSYPVSAEKLGLTPGSVATMLEAALDFEYPGSPSTKCHRLGKPFAPIFEEAHRRAGTHKMVMIGDHVATDILGASNFGIDSALVTFDEVSARTQLRASTISPTFLLPSFSLAP